MTLERDNLKDQMVHLIGRHAAAQALALAGRLVHAGPEDKGKRPANPVPLARVLGIIFARDGWSMAGRTR